MKPIDPCIYRAALDRLDIYKKALTKIVSSCTSMDDAWARDIAKAALDAVADADLWDSGKHPNDGFASTSGTEHE